MGASRVARGRRQRAEPDPALERHHDPGHRNAASNAARHAADRHRSVRHRHRHPRRADPPQRRRHAGRSPVRQTRHHRLELRARRIVAADHPRPRRQPRAHAGRRHRRQRRVRPGRGSFRADRSAHRRPHRGDPRTGDLALRLAGDRRRGRNLQQPHSDGNPVARTQRRSARRRLDHRQRGRRRTAARCRRRQRRVARRRLRPHEPRLSRAALSVSQRARRHCLAERDAARRVRRTAAELESAQRRPGGRRVLHLQRRLSRARRHPEQCALSHSRRRGRKQPHAHRRAPDQADGEGRMAGAERRDRRAAVLGRRDRLQAQRNRSGRSGRPDQRRRAANLYQQGAGRPRRSATDAVRPALRGADHRARRPGRTSGTDRTEPGRQRPVRPEQEQPPRRLHVQRAQVQRDHQSATGGPHRARHTRRQRARFSNTGRADIDADLARLHAEEREHRADPAIAV